MSDLIQSSLFTFQCVVPTSRWTLSFGKRFFDAVVAAFLLIVAAPLMLVIAVVVQISSPGPAFFRQTRVGQNGHPFTLLKFRSMKANSDPQTNLTRRGDQRITAVGRFLRKTKLDELPQLYNVVCGDMSMVGPRPDMPEYMATLEPALHPVLLLKPGLTGLASLEFRNEEVVLARVAPEHLRALYVETILPRKVGIELTYAKTASLWSDLKIIARTVGVVFSRRLFL